MITHAVQPQAESIDGRSPRPPLCPECMAQVRGGPTEDLRVFSFGEIDTFGIWNGLEGIDVAEGTDRLVAQVLRGLSGPKSRRCSASVRPNRVCK